MTTKPFCIINVTLHPDATGRYPWNVRMASGYVASGIEDTYATAEANAASAVALERALVRAGVVQSPAALTLAEGAK